MATAAACVARAAYPDLGNELWLGPHRSSHSSISPVTAHQMICRLIRSGSVRNAGPLTDTQPGMPVATLTMAS
ncbi:unnamed protein product [Gadus morhua 'NCC']